MWVPRTPKRSDFCGCPPCPLCYDWATEPPTGRVQDAWVQEIISGMTKFTGDVLEGKKPTESEKETLQKAAEKIHVANLNADRIYSDQLREADQAQNTQRQMDALLAAKRREAAAPKPLNTVVLDGRDLSYVEEEERRKKEPAPVQMVTFAKLAEQFRKQAADEARPSWVIPIYGGNWESWAIDEISQVSGLKVTSDKPKPDDKERRRIQAEVDAKKRMKVAAREAVRR